MHCPYLYYCGFCPFKSYPLYPSQKWQLHRFPTNQNPLTITMSEIKNNTDTINESLKIPVLKGQINPQVLSFINTNIRNDILEFKNQMETAADESAEESKKKGKAFNPFQISNTYIVTYNQNNILSISLIYQQYINGRNSYIRTTYNYNLQTGKPMPLGDLFRDGVNYTEVLNRKIRKNYFPGNPEKFKGIAADQPYYLDDHTLILFLNFNEIAPTASEIPVVKIPFSEINTLLKPQFLK